MAAYEPNYENDPLGDGSGAVSPGGDDERKLAEEDAAQDAAKEQAQSTAASPSVEASSEAPQETPQNSSAHLSMQQAFADSDATSHNTAAQYLDTPITMKSFTTKLGQLLDGPPHDEVQTSANTAQDAGTPAENHQPSLATQPKLDAQSHMPDFSTDRAALEQTYQQLQAAEDAKSKIGVWDFRGTRVNAADQKIDALTRKAGQQEHILDRKMQYYQAQHPEIYSKPDRYKAGDEGFQRQADGSYKKVISADYKPATAATAAAAKAELPVKTQLGDQSIVDLYHGANGQPGRIVPYLTDPSPMPQTTSQGSPNFGAGDMINSIMSQQGARGPAPATKAAPLSPEQIQKNAAAKARGTASVPKQAAAPRPASPNQETVAHKDLTKARGEEAAAQAANTKLGRRKEDPQAITSRIETKYHLDPGALGGKGGRPVSGTTSGGVKYTIAN